MRRLLIATTNRAKLAEYRLILRNLGIELELVSLADVGISETPEETGATFTENALLKARFYFERARIATLADDGGLEIDALVGQPGVAVTSMARLGWRWFRRALVAEVIRRMKGVETARRTARIRAMLGLIHEENGLLRQKTAEGAIEGVIAERAYPEIRAGFPYRAVLVIPERSCYLGELGDGRSPNQPAPNCRPRAAGGAGRIAAGRAAG